MIDKVVVRHVGLWVDRFREHLLYRVDRLDWYHRLIGS